MWLADLAFFAGDQDVGLAAAQRSVELAEKFGSPFSRIGADWRLGVALFLNGQVNEARETLEHTLALMRQCGTGLEVEARLLAWLAEAVIAGGDVARARQLADEALAVADRTGAVLDGIFARRTLARVLLGGRARRRRARSRRPWTAPSGSSSRPAR